MEFINSLLFKGILFFVVSIAGLYFLYMVLRISFLAIFKSYFDAKKQHKEGKDEFSR